MPSHPPATPPTQPIPPQAEKPRRSYRYYDLLMAGFVTVLLCSNLIGPGKSCAITLPASIVPDFKDGQLVFTTLLVFGASFPAGTGDGVTTPSVTVDDVSAFSLTISATACVVVPWLQQAAW